MAGTAPDCELTGAGRVEFALATAAEDPALRRLLRETPMRGAVDLTFEREPHYFHGEDLAGAEDRTIAAFEDGALVCMGRCSYRPCWVNGREARTGYLAELRLHPAARRRYRILREGYRFFHETEPPGATALHFTSIASDNGPARRLLERGARGLPAYTFLGELTTVVIEVPRHARAGALRVERAAPEHRSSLLRLLRDHGRRHQLSAVWTSEMLEETARAGLPLDRFLLGLEGGEVVACAALWDQRRFRQTVIRGYRPALSALRPLFNLGRPLFRAPRLPPAGSVLAHALLSPLAFAPGAEELLPEMAAACLPLAAQLGLEFLTLVLPGGDRRLRRLRQRFSTKSWSSRLYRVDWPGETALDLHPDGGAFLPELAFL